MALTSKLPKHASQGAHITLQHGLSEGKLKTGCNCSGARYIVCSYQGNLMHEWTVCNQALHKGMETKLVSLMPLYFVHPTYLPSKRLAALTQMNWRQDRFSWLAEKVTANFTRSPTFLKVTVGTLKHIVPSHLKLKYNVYPLLFNNAAVPLSRLRCDITTAPML